MDRLTRANKELEHVEAEIRRLQERITARREQAERLRGFIETWHMLGPPEQEEEKKADGAVQFDQETTIIEATKTILRRSSRPLKARQIASRMLAAGFPYTDGEDNLVRSLRGVLSRYTGKGVLAKVGKGQYTLPTVEAEQDHEQPELGPIERSRRDADGESDEPS